jgi:hypothetical protein
MNIINFSLLNITATVVSAVILFAHHFLYFSLSILIFTLIYTISTIVLVNLLNSTQPGQIVEEPQLTGSTGPSILARPTPQSSPKPGKPSNNK